MRRAIFVGVLTALAALALTACNGAKNEAKVLVPAVDQYRAAKNDQKPALADALDKVPCTDPEVCAAKDACTKAADPTAKGLRIQKEVEQGLDDVKAGKLPADSDQAKALPGKLDESGHLLDQGFKALKSCDELVERLRVKYHL